MPTRKKLAVLLLLGCLIAAQIHTLADLDPCLITGGTSHNGPGHNHRCQGCESGALVIAGALPSLSPLLHSAQVDLFPRVQFLCEHRAEGRAPRAPPASLTIAA